ncbi:hypothetical protein J4Q44_G00393210 [Coregonus suidteri]|uniref:Uncharacterized protein n=1 Tax=Coregonus suidteri TaxID=861788 RepID=A0AAN8Q3G5_9TELE
MLQPLNIFVFSQQTFSIHSVKKIHALEVLLKTQLLAICLVLHGNAIPGQNTNVHHGQKRPCLLCPPVAVPAPSLFSRHQRTPINQ